MSTAQLQQVATGVRMMLAPNPGPLTFTGTQVFVVGHGEVAVIDPGPDDPVHVATLIDALAGETVTAILCTHTHRDHSPASRAAGGRRRARGSSAARRCALMPAARADDSLDPDYAPDAVLGRWRSR